MTDFIPPYPHRHAKTLGPLDMIKYLRRDMLSIWPEKAFKRNFINIKLVTHTVNIANFPDAVEYVLIHNPDNYARKSGLMRKGLSPLLAESLLLSDGDVWQKNSDLIRPFFSTEQVAKFSETVIKTTEAFAEDWEKHNTVSVFPDMKALSANILCRLLFGEQVNKSQCHDFVQQVDTFLAAIEELDINSFFGLPSWFGGNKTDKAIKAIHTCIDQIIANHQATDDGSLLTLFLNLPANTFSRQQIRHELLTFFLAGYETTAATLAWAWYLIAHRPKVEQRLHEEVTSQLSNGTAIDVTKLTYTRAIIDETLRLYPPFPILSREVKANDSFHDIAIAAGSTMLIVPWLLHRHPGYWENPDHFMPERFLEDAPTKFQRFAYLPYSFGARECVAKQLSSTQTTLCLAILAKRFRLTSTPGLTAQPICKILLRPNNNLPMVLVKK